MTTEEIEHIVYDYGEDIYRFCRHLTFDNDMADELYQETFLKATQLSSRLERSGNVKSFLMGIAANIWKNMLKKNARRNEILPQGEYDENIKNVEDTKGDILEIFVENQIINDVKVAINNLKEKQRIVVILHYCEDFSAEEISKMLHIPRGTVLSRLAKARKIIKKEMEMKGYEV